MPRRWEKTNQRETINMPHCPVRKVSQIQNGCPQRPTIKPQRNVPLEANRVIEAQENINIAAWTNDYPLIQLDVATGGRGSAGAGTCSACCWFA